MSKMSQLHAELSEQTAELGFESLGEAEQAGYGVGWENAKLIKVEDEQEKAHEAWLKERDEVLEEQRGLHDRLMELGYDALAESVWHAITFIEEQCHD